MRVVYTPRGDRAVYFSRWFRTCGNIHSKADGTCRAICSSQMKSAIHQQRGIQEEHEAQDWLSRTDGWVRNRVQKRGLAWDLEHSTDVGGNRHALRQTKTTFD